MILLMSVNPGFGGQAFTPAVFKKIEQARDIIDASGRPIRLEVDGGVNLSDIQAIARAGADTFVAGTAIFGSRNYQAAIAAMRLELAKMEERQYGNRRHANKKT